MRWVASSYRTVNAVWSSYAALHQHFVQESTNFALDGKERATYAGLHKKLELPVFLKNLAIMADALEELADLSQNLQADAINLPYANRLIQRQIELFQARRKSGGDKCQIADEAITAQKFGSVVLGTSSGRESAIDRNQFYQALSDSLNSRPMLDTKKPLLESMEIIFPSKWSDSLPPEYGERELKLISAKFLVPYSLEVKQAYRDYKESKGFNILPPMQLLLGAVGTLPVSTAACERGFSKMNIVCSPLRNSLTVAHMSSLMFISIVGPPVLQWNPAAYVRTRIAYGRRDATSRSCAQRKQSPGESASNATRAMWELF